MTEVRAKAKRAQGKRPRRSKARLERSALDVAGDPTEITELYQNYSGRLSRTLRKMFGDGPPDPDDIAQLAFQKLIERGDLSSIRNLKAIVWRSARNLWLKEKDRENTRCSHDFEIEQLYFPRPGYGSAPETVIQAREQLAAVNKTLMQMPDMRRRAYVLCRVDGLSITEVGKRLGISRPAASKHISRATADIDAALVEDQED